LVRHEWPLNIRELERCLQAAVVLATSGLVETAHLTPSVLGTPAMPRSPERPQKAEEPLSEDDLQRRERIVAAIRASGGNVTVAAEALGEHRMQLYRWLRRYGIDPKSYRPAS
jgi:Nif-specific regulatory protein